MPRQGSGLRAFLLVRRLGLQSRLRSRHPRSGLSHSRRSEDRLGRALEHARLLAFAHQLAARHLPALCVRFRSEAESDFARRAGIYSPRRGRRRPGTAVLQRVGLLAHRRRDYRASRLHAEQLRRAGRSRMDPWLTLGQIRSGISPHPVEYVSGDRTQFLLHLRFHVSHQRCGRQSAAGRSGDLLPGTGRFPARPARLESRCLRAGRVAHQPASDLQLRASLRARQPNHRER